LKEIVKSDEFCISNPKSEISNWTVRSAKDSSDFKIPQGDL